SLKEEVDIVSEKETIELKKYPLFEIFDFISGNSKITVKYINKNKGEYPVYSSNTKNKGIMGYINSYDHEKECIQITTNGIYAGTVFYRPKHKFSINGDARLLIKKYENLDYHYLTKEVEKAFSKYKFNWENKPTVGKTKNIEISIPINSEGKFDLEAQKQIAEKYRIIEEIKSTIVKELERIENIKIDIN
ncbi:restriction endonuclease subunit S, partial [bacterium]|nr:restriction endonuclease subunit S [bacterium]